MSKKKLLNLNHNKLDQVIILAGGLGERLFPLTKDKPKPMIKFFGLPFLEYIVKENVRNKFKKILILLGYKGKVIEDYFGNGRKFGIMIDYDYQPVHFDTGLRLKKAKNKIDDIFMLQYCDNFIPFDRNLLFENFKREKKDLMLSLYDNTDNYSRSNISLTKKNEIKVYDKCRKKKNLKFIDIGYVIMKKKILNLLTNKNTNFENKIYPQLIKEKKISSFIFKHRYYSIGNLKRLNKTHNFFKNKNKFILLDRDGVINEKPPKADYVKTWDDWKWKPKALDFLKKLNELKYNIVIITNQAGINRKKMNTNDLEKIHQIMKAQIIDFGGYVKDIFYCPHDWDEGCFCRKPKAGMFFDAQKKYDIDLSSTYYVGDDDRDEEAANKAGCKFFRISGESSYLNFLRELKKDFKGKL